MLGMLMKYEWKYIWKKFLLFTGLMVVATVIGYLSCSLFMNIDPQNEATLVNLGFGMLGYMLYYTVMIGSIMAFTVIVAIRFYKTVFGGMGYITHTLPVSGRQIYAAHLLLYGICMFVITILTQISVSIVSDLLFSGVFGAMDEAAYAEFPFRNGIWGIFFGNSLARIPVMIVYLAGSALVSLLLIYASIVLGQYWKRYKVWGAILSYLIISTIMAVFVFATLIPYMMGALLQGGPMKITEFIMGGSFWWINLAYTLLFGLAALWIVDHGITKRLNLE